MEFKQVFSREYLQTERARYHEAVRVQAVMRHVESHHQLILGAAREGKTHYTIETTPDGFQCGGYTPTIEDLLEGYRIKFPDCKVEYGESWEPSPRNPNQMNRKSGIIIDWS